MATNPLSNNFLLEGAYRVQSFVEPLSASLKGQWLSSAAGYLTASDVNGALQRHDAWTGGSLSRLRTAIVEARAGVFASHDDALYYAANFSSVRSTVDFDILDLSKLGYLWVSRLPFLRRIIEPQSFVALTARLSPVLVHANNEYQCHEGGHRLGWQLSEKYALGYFRITGQLAWPLIFVEEHRADLLSLELALRLLDDNAAILVFVYQVLHRLGLAAYNRLRGRSDDGGVPFLLFCRLMETRTIEIQTMYGRSGICFRNLTTDGLCESMRTLANAARDDLLLVEMGKANPLDVALNAAAYYRVYALSDNLVKYWNALFQAEVCSRLLMG